MNFFCDGYLLTKTALIFPVGHPHSIQAVESIINIDSDFSWLHFSKVDWNERRKYER